MSHLSYFRTFLLFILFLLAQGFLHRGIVADQKEVFFFNFGFFVYFQVLKNAYFECEMIKTQFCLIFCMSIIIYQSLTLSHKNLVILSCSYKTFSEYIYIRIRVMNFFIYSLPLYTDWSVLAKTTLAWKKLEEETSNSSNTRPRLTCNK